MSNTFAQTATLLLENIIDKLLCFFILVIFSNFQQSFFVLKCQSYFSFILVSKQMFVVFKRDYTRKFKFFGILLHIGSGIFDFLCFSERIPLKNNIGEEIRSFGLLVHEIHGLQGIPWHPKHLLEGLCIFICFYLLLLNFLRSFQ